jgi:hypothetical protein
VPPQYAKTERQMVDEHGRVVETRPRELSAEEFAERERQQAAAAAEQKRRVEQAAYDQFLLQSYSGVDELQRARQDRLAALQARLTLTEKTSASTRSTLEQLRNDAAQAQSDAKLKQQVRDYEKAAGDHDRALEMLRKERQNVCATFARDIRRFQELKNLPPTRAPECPQG